MLEDFIIGLGIDHFGYALIPEDYRPFPYLPYAISLGVPLSKTVVSSIRKGPTHTYFHHYRTTNAYLDNAAIRLMLYIEKLGKSAVYIPASQTVDSEGIRGLFSHKMAAFLAGLGGIGQNALFVSEKHGPALRLSTVLTDVPLQTGSPIQNPCTDCGICVQACPAGALTGETWHPGIPREELVDAKKCSLHMKKAYRSIGRGGVCGICMAVCPLCNAD
jgi:epoxyqueuosine reductase QueG